MLKMEFDFIVIGAGPIGSYLARLLASDGFRVAIFDRKKEVGKDVLCSGIIGSEPYREFNLPEEAIISRISDGSLFSPSMIQFYYSHDLPFAYIADREKLDKILYRRAVEKGVEAFLGSSVIDLEKEKGRVCIEYLNNGYVKKISARCLVIATGADFALHRKAGLLAPKRFLWGSRVEFDCKLDGPLEIYILNNPDLGSFGWVIPLENKVRIGALSVDHDRSAIHRLIQKTNGRFRFSDYRIEGAPIAYGDSKKMVSERVIAVGEAAGQVKTTTGGGIHYGLIGARFAYNVLKKTALEDDFSEDRLLEYERLWRIKMGQEIKSGMALRNLVAKIPSKTVDIIFNWARKDPAIEEKIKQQFCFDYHKNLVDFGMELILGRNTLRRSKFSLLPF